LLELPVSGLVWGRQLLAGETRSRLLQARR
jgi:hypothetical protein